MSHWAVRGRVYLYFSANSLDTRPLTLNFNTIAEAYNNSATIGVDKSFLPLFFSRLWKHLACLALSEAAVSTELKGRILLRLWICYCDWPQIFTLSMFVCSSFPVLRNAAAGASGVGNAVRLKVSLRLDARRIRRYLERFEVKHEVCPERPTVLDALEFHNEDVIFSIDVLRIEKMVLCETASEAVQLARQDESLTTFFLHDLMSGVQFTCRNAKAIALPVYFGNGMNCLSG